MCLLKEFLLIKCCTAAFAYSCSWQRQTYFSFNSNIEFTGIVLKLSIFKDFMDHMIIHFMESFGCDYCFLKTSKTLLIRCNSEIWLKFLCFCVYEMTAFLSRVLLVGCGCNIQERRTFSLVRLGVREKLKYCWFI